MSDKRLIDANAVENHLFYTTRENDDYNEGYFDGVRDAKEIVRNSKTIDPETLQPQWIDVQEKLPEEYQSVLGVANGVDVRIVHYALGGFWMEDTTGEEYNVTYWMPLPKIPKEN